MSDAESIGVLVGHGASRLEARGRGQRLLGRLGDLQSLARAGPRELLAVSGLRRAQVRVLRAALELGRRLQQPPDRAGPITTAEQAFAMVRAHFLGLTYEVFVVLALDARHQLLRRVQVAQGSATRVEVHPREVFGPVLRDGAAGVIVAHNHPSGDPQPSDDDVLLTQRLRTAGEVLGVPVLDHLVVGGSRYVSLAARGWL